MFLSDKGDPTDSYTYKVMIALPDADLLLQVIDNSSELLFVSTIGTRCRLVPSVGLSAEHLQAEGWRSSASGVLPRPGLHGVSAGMLQGGSHRSPRVPTRPPEDEEGLAPLREHPAELWRLDSAD